MHCCSAAEPSPLLPCCIVAGCVGLSEALRIVADAEGLGSQRKAAWLGLLLGEAPALSDTRTMLQKWVQCAALGGCWLVFMCCGVVLRMLLFWMWLAV